MWRKKNCWVRFGVSHKQDWLKESVLYKELHKSFVQYKIPYAQQYCNHQEYNMSRSCPKHPFKAEICHFEVLFGYGIVCSSADRQCRIIESIYAFHKSRFLIPLWPRFLECAIWKRALQPNCSKYFENISYICRKCFTNASKDLISSVLYGPHPSSDKLSVRVNIPTNECPSLHPMPQASIWAIKHLCMFRVTFL